MYTACPRGKIVVNEQAPGSKVQATGVPWDDGSGKNLIEWLAVTAEQFRNPDLFFLLPMDFYYPGTGRSGDPPPDKRFRLRAPACS